ncbi:MAG: 4Fe-4S dicluster domain-containing protein [Planctomycetes bacterium]|nr:4Fe-4S dicluster domain-containing protein [Planctomycetota bacterium]
MKLRGGYTVQMAGKPVGSVEVLPDPDELYLPLFSRRFRFTELCVGDGDRVRPGKVLARDPSNHGVPLLAPREGTVRLNAIPRHLVLQNVSAGVPEPLEDSDEPSHIPRNLGSVEMKRNKLLLLGAWQYFFDAHSGALPNPFGTPQAVIVSTLNLEPFLGRGDVQLRARLKSFTRGLEQIQTLLEYQPIFLILPKVAAALAEQVSQAIRGYAHIKPVHVPLRYPFDNFTVLARYLGLKRQKDQPVWALRTEGVLALDRALTASKPCDLRVISIGGPAATSPAHVVAMPGYPLKTLLSKRIADGPVRVLNGGVLSGQEIAPDQAGLDCECLGITALGEQTEREFLAFVRPGAGRWSYSRCFLSALRRPMPERMTTAIRGEHRPCVSCGFCEEICPAGIMPHLLHKLLYQDDLEAAIKVRLDLCVACGLCSFVCPSKIDLCGQFQKAMETFRMEQMEHMAQEAPA